MSGSRVQGQFSTLRPNLVHPRIEDQPKLLLQKLHRMEPSARRQQPGCIQARIRTIATIGFAIYGVYKLGEWAINAIRENKRQKEDSKNCSSSAAMGDLPPPGPRLDRKTRKILQQHRRVTCAKDVLSFMQRMSPSLRESIAEVTSIASERKALKQLRGEPAEQQQEQWDIILRKTFTRLFLTISAEAILFTVVHLHIHLVASMQLPSAQSSLIMLKLFDTLVLFVTDDMEKLIHGAVDAEMSCIGWNTATSDAALHMTYAKLKIGLDGCWQNIHNSIKLILWDQYVNLLDEEFCVSKDRTTAELLDLMESPLAKETMVEISHAFYRENETLSIQPVFAERGELPLAQVIAKMSKSAFDLEKEHLARLRSVQHIGHLLFPEDS